MYLAGLYENWLDVETGEETNSCSIVTTKGNELMSSIHNNPKLEGPRMPVILEPIQSEDWLVTINNKGDQEQINALLRPTSEEILMAHTVKKLKGKDVDLNAPTAADKFDYSELSDESNDSQLRLF
jgi:putative SOS response-associated peptidase YedK